MGTKQTEPANPALVINIVEVGGSINNILGISKERAIELARDMQTDQHIAEAIEMYSRIVKTPEELVFIAYSLGRYTERYLVNKKDNLI